MKRTADPALEAFENLQSPEALERFMKAYSATAAREIEEPTRACVLRRKAVALERDAQGFHAGDVPGPQFVGYQALEAGRIQLHGPILPVLEGDAHRVIEVDRHAPGARCDRNPGCGSPELPPKGRQPGPMRKPKQVRATPAIRGTKTR